MIFKRIVFPLFIVAVFNIDLNYAQNAGESTYQFLNISNSPRQLALGGKNITILDDDVVSGLYNPSSINQDMDNMLAINYFSYF